MANRNLRGVGVVNVFSKPSLDDFRIVFFVFLGEAVGCALGRRCFKIVEIAGFFLVGDHPPAHMIEDFKAYGDAALIGDVIFIAREIAYHLVHTIYTYRRKVIAEEWKITRGIGVKSAVVHFLGKGALFLQRRFADIHQTIDFLHQAIVIAFKPVSQPRHIERDDAYGSGHFR